MKKFIILITIAIFILTADAAGSTPDKNSKPTNAKQPGSNGKPSNAPPRPIRVPMTNVPISEDLIEINKRLTMNGTKKKLTEKQATWIARFVKTIRNWLYFVGITLENDKFKKIYNKHMQNEFDMWITSRRDQAVDMYYKNANDPEAPPVHYKIIIYRISVGDIALVENFNLKSLEIDFKKSKEKLRTPQGKMAYRKDRVYVLELEADFPLLDVKIRHEIVHGNEEGAFNEHVREEKQDVKPGYLRIRMSSVKTSIKVVLTEIDKRFVRKDPETGETYYFTRPEILDFNFLIGEANVILPYDFQSKPNMEKGFVGENLPQSIAKKILRDFDRLLVLEENRREFQHRFKMALINKYSKAIMLSTDILLLFANLDQETAFYDPNIPLEVDEDDMLMISKVFYTSYSIKTFTTTCAHFLFKALELQSMSETDEKKDKTKKLTPEELKEKQKKDAENLEKLIDLGNEAEKWMNAQAAEAGEKLDIRNDGFDWDEEL